MSKKIVVITGSPRKDGNSFAMTDAFIQAAQAKGHSVTRFDAAMLKIGGCRACETCYKTGKACSFDDDFNAIAPAILEADALVFTMPRILVFHSRANQGRNRPHLLHGSGRQGHFRQGMRADRLLRGGRPERIGRRAHPHGAHCGAEQMENGGRSARPRRAQPRRRGKNRWLRTGSGIGG